ncbi:hypothetical protein [Bradyrhizobium liaoningense]|uniref:hypothetical protein n=1 Tax=Bradyrhizobium liaoningense TaxID=43992 RepID=UPI001BAADFF7|nr:hypothetical protein [Bradyrhizobium liaoningense]MBR0982338.1 hypothetical protein [Bradyrhizobium liaoningense]
MTTPEQSNWPRAPGRHRKAYLARQFGSYDGRPESIPDPFARRRYRARIKLESAFSTLWKQDALRFCTTPADVEAAKRRAHQSVAELEAWHRKALQRPALLHSGNAFKFCLPFGDDDEKYYDWTWMDDYCDEGSPTEAPVTSMVAQIPEGRLKLIACCAGSPDSRAETVPDDWRPWYSEQFAYQEASYEQALEDICRHYGPTGRPVDIPKSNHAAAACYWRRWTARQEMLSRFEYELHVIDAEEQKEREAEEAAERKAEDFVRAVERQIEDAAYAILDDVLSETS